MRALAKKPRTPCLLPSNSKYRDWLILSYQKSVWTTLRPLRGGRIDLHAAHGAASKNSTHHINDRWIWCNRDLAYWDQINIIRSCGEMLTNKESH